MQTQSTFTDVGWDFLGETVNGISDFWVIQPGQYPELTVLSDDFGPYIFAGGSGTEEEPYEIYDAYDLGAVWQYPQAYFILYNDVNLSDIQWSTAVVPVLFTGQFDGNGFKVSNLSISGGDYLGLFSNIGPNGQVMNLGIEDVTITGGDYSSYLGGVCGSNNGTISSCYVTGNITAGDYSEWIGGLCGCNGQYYYDGTISNCYMVGKVKGGNYSDFLGGLCGGILEGAVFNCYVAGAVMVDLPCGNWIGGLCGNCGTNSTCYVLDTTYPDNDGATPLTNSEMVEQSSFAGWDFVGESANGDDDYWDIVAGHYPKLAWQSDDGPLPWEPYSGGVGSEEEPFRIANAEDLVTMHYRQSDLDKHFELLADIDMAGAGDNPDGSFSAAVIGPDTDNSNYYFDGTAFTGVFDGNNCKITNLTIDANGTANSYLGLFSVISPISPIGPNTQVRNLILEDVNIIGGDYSHYLGGLCGYTNGEYNSTTISNCYVTGSVTGGVESGYLGGLCGKSDYGTISNCYVTISVTGGYGSKYIGGLCGRNYAVTISGCNATGNVKGGAYLGGLCGSSVKGYGAVVTISNCWADVNITTCGGTYPPRYLGGLCGYNVTGTISNCYATGSVTGGDYYELIGGLCGRNGEFGGAEISNCYATGSVTGGDDSKWIGGLCGYNNRSIISACYATGVVAAGNDFDNLGGLCGANDGTIFASFWDVDTSNEPNSAGGEGKTTAQMKTASTFIGWGGCGSEGVWTIDEGKDYPRLLWQNLPGQPLPSLSDLFEGTGTVEDQYLIYTAEQLNSIGRFPCVWDKQFVLTADIDLVGYTGTQFNIIGSEAAPFTGVFDGNGHTISNFTYTATDTDYIGLFGYVEGPNAVIKNVTLVYPDVNAAGESYYVASLVGWLESGTITGCGVDGGSVTGTSYTGGLVGNNSEGWISNCYAACIVSGGSAGGLVGYNDGWISNCYAQGITEDNRTGGLVGRNDGTISNCYAAASISGDSTGGLVGYSYHGRVYASFWDVNSSGLDTSAGGEGKTTVEMKTADTFIYATWSVCGNEGVWTIDEGNDYPRLAWQNLPGQPLPSMAELLHGTGSKEQPYLVRTAEQLNLIGLSRCEWDKHFKLVADIDLSAYTGTQFNKIGNSTYPFTGVFDGNGHTISNFTYTATHTGCIGLFAYVDDANALIKDLTLVDPNVNAASWTDYVASIVGWLESGTISGCGIEGGSVSGEDYYVGGMVGKNAYGTIENCYTTGVGSVMGTRYTGGLVGENEYGTISDCYSSASVTGYDYTGGLVGYDYRGTISNCHTAGSVTGDECTGGLVGRSSTIENCYSIASVSGVDEYTGGLVGYNSGTISNSYAAGGVTGAHCTGGLVGKNRDGKISNCYATGEVSTSGTSWQGGYFYSPYDNVVVNGMGYLCLQGHTSSSSFEDDLAAGHWELTTGGLVGSNYEGTIVASFWDAEIGGPDNGIGTGLPTSQMQTMSTFTDAGWDFVEESVNGLDDIWDICEGTNYPKLAWQILLPGDFVCPDGVDFMDYAVLTEQWQLEVLSWDVEPAGGDRFVNFLDWAVLADGWQNTIGLNDVADFAGQWLQFGAYCADIAPSPGGDGAVDMLDFAVLADNWLEGL